MRPYVRRAARLNAKGVKKQRKCDRIREQRRVRTLRESENAILYEKCGACECGRREKAEKMESYAITAACGNAESKSTEIATVCENSGVRML